MKRLLMIPILLFTLALGVAGCTDTIAKFQRAGDIITSASVSSKNIVLGIQAFDAAKIGATGYLRLRRCTGTNGPICRDPAVTITLDNAIQEGTRARNDLKAWLRNNPDGLGSQSTFDKLTAATTAIERAIAVYTAATR